MALTSLPTTAAMEPTVDEMLDWTTTAAAVTEEPPVVANITPATTMAPHVEDVPFWWNSKSFGIRGGSDHCVEWYPSTPGSFYQLFGVLMHLAFIASGNSSSAAIFNNFTCALAFFSMAVWGGIQACGVDFVVWGILICISNLAQVCYGRFKSKQTEEAFEGDQNKVYKQFFAPFNISRTIFTDLVGIKGFHIMTLQKDHCYAIENKTTVDRLALVVSGKLRVHIGDKILHYVQKNEFIDSPEWEAMKGSNKKGSLFRVTITAESTSRCIVWKRKPLLALLSKEKQLGKILNCIIGQDIVKKLTVLNSRRFTERGFHYDVRLPCVISLRDDVEERERRMMAQMTPNQAGQRSRKLGRRATQEYAKLFGPKTDIKEEEGLLRKDDNFISELEDN